MSDRSTKPIRLYDCLYIPSCPINLFSGFKLVQAGGYIKGGFLRTKDHKEICRHDHRLFIIEGEKEAGVSDNSDIDDIDESVALPAALERAEPNIELWHRRLGHLSFGSIQKTKKLVKGLDFKEKDTPPTVIRLCDLCKKGRLIRHVRRQIDYRPLHALDVLYIDVVMLTPRSFPSRA